MASTNYSDLTAIKSWVSIPTATTTYDTIITGVSSATFDAINQYCGRVFATSTGSRVYEAVRSTYGYLTGYMLEVDDISTAVGVTVSHDSGNDATYDVTWASTDYELRPLNGLLHGVSWPYTSIRAVGNQAFPVTWWAGDRAHVQVSATWGWPAVPDAVVQASKILAEDLFKSKDAPFGVAGNAEFGSLRVSANVAGLAKMLLAPYRKYGVMVG